MSIFYVQYMEQTCHLVPKVFFVFVFFISFDFLPFRWTHFLNFFWLSTAQLCQAFRTSLFSLCLQCRFDSVLVSGMHVNCDNEGQPEEQLELLSEFTVLPVGKSLPSVNLTRILKNTICSPPTTSHLFQACHWEIQSQSQEPFEICVILWALLSRLASIETKNKLN